MDSMVILKVNDKEISLNAFVSDVFNNVINGLLDSLDKIPEDRKSIELQIKKKEN